MKENNLDVNKSISIALVGNANVGKSAIFNQLTGLNQQTGNWPGKTVDMAEGILWHHGQKIRIIDLPGVYSFSGYSPDEQESLDYLTKELPDAVINVVDATSLERNMFITLQLLEMNLPVVMALNLNDVAGKKGIKIDAENLSRILGIPVEKTIALKGKGVHELIDHALAVAGKPRIDSKEKPLEYGREIESRVSLLEDRLKKEVSEYPIRWAALKLLEGDENIVSYFSSKNRGIVELAGRLKNELEEIHGEDVTAVITSERYAVAARVSKAVSTFTQPRKPGISSRLDAVSMHAVLGYLVLLVLMLSIIIFISIFGGWFTEVITGFFESFRPDLVGPLPDILWNGTMVGFYAALSVALGFILPFYIILGFLEDWGYLPRIAFLMDGPSHIVGLHGQASMPFMLAFGCNVPACLSCRILENRRDRFLAMFLTTMVPCSARASVIMGLVGAFVGWQWAVALYIFQFGLILIVGRILNRILPGNSPGVIMEIPEYRIPNPMVVLKQSWFRFRDFLTLGIPLIVAGSTVIEALRVFEYLGYFTRLLAPVTEVWLGLPDFTGILLLFGILRKEASLALLTTFSGGAEIGTVMTPLQMVVYSIVVLLYIPCISTIAALVKETGWKNATLIAVTEVGMAVVIGGIAYRVLGLLPSMKPPLA